VDPDKATLFVQSAVPEHCELTVLLSMFTSVGWLERNPTYKEQKQELGEKNTGSLGFLSYPVLQTVDVCLYKATHVPVGEDQKPHLEMGRELIRRFNSTYKKDVFPEFLPLLTPTAKLPGLDGRKMSKSYGNTVELAEEPESIRKKVSRMMTDTQRPRKEDPGHPENCPVFTYHQLFTPTARVSEIEKECRAATLTCFDDKKALAEQIVAWSEPIRKRRAELEKEPAYIDEIIKKGNQKARNIASQTIKEVLDVMGFWPGSNR
jgi:tryptophanyl-tRNA synthetase